jgi:hypothetical protein
MGEQHLGKGRRQWKNDRNIKCMPSRCHPARDLSSELKPPSRANAVPGIADAPTLPSGFQRPAEGAIGAA